MNARPLRIMVIDDEAIVGKRLKPALEKSGNTVDSYEDPEKAIADFIADPADIVVTDIRMDKLDGIEILNRVLAHSGSAKVIVITGYATVEIAREALSKGAFDFIAKPFKPSDLRQIIDRAAEEIFSLKEA